MIAAINTANSNGENNTINLEAGTYALTAIDNNADGPNALPFHHRKHNYSRSGQLPNYNRPIRRGSISRIGLTGVSTIEALTLTGGVVNAQLGASRGAIIYNLGSLTVIESDISTDLISVEPVVLGYLIRAILLSVHPEIFHNERGDGVGGGILNTGTAHIEDSIIFRNAASSIGSGGGIFNSGKIIISRSSIINNFARRGGGLSNSGTVNLDRVFIGSNSVSVGIPGTRGVGGDIATKAAN